MILLVDDFHQTLLVIPKSTTDEINALLEVVEFIGIRKSSQANNDYTSRVTK